MLQLQAHTMELSGTSYEIGVALGKMTAAIPPLKAHHTSQLEGFTAADSRAAADLFSRWCPGLNDELSGFADVLGVPAEQILYCAMTYLRPNCSHIALLPEITACGRPLLARNYEFNHEMEDFALLKTSVTGKYTHIGTSVLHFGRDDGFNEHGLAITMSSCGFPVGPLPGMRKPKLIGLQFWAITRALLENCKDVNEALAYLKDMPVAYNLNMIMLDRNNRAALVETLDGRIAVKRIEAGDSKHYLCATNHVLLPDLIAYEPVAMRNSLIRYELITEHLNGAKDITSNDLKQLLLIQYPNGLCCHGYKEFFGTTKSMVIDPVDQSIELCWGGRTENGWQRYRLSDPLPNKEIGIALEFNALSPSEFEFLPLN